jgi:hypothetical protein
MDDLIDGAEIEVACDCGAVVKVTVGQLRQSPTLTCPHGHVVKVDGSQLDRDLRPVDHALDRLNRSIKNLSP